MNKKSAACLAVIGWCLAAAWWAGWGETAEQPRPGGAVKQALPTGSPTVTPQNHTDLELTDIWVNDPLQCHPRIKVTNRGTAVFDGARPCMLNYYVDGNLFAPISGCTGGKTLNPGESYVFEFGASFVPGPGSHTLKAEVDVGNKIIESNEGNNIKEVTVTCGGKVGPPQHRERKP